MQIEWDELAMWAAMVVACVLLAGAVVGSIWTARIRAECQAKGWRDGLLNVDGIEYCTARIDQSDVVVPLAKAWKR